MRPSRCQLGHQRRQAGAFLVDVAAGLGHLLRHLVAQLAALSHQLVEGGCQALQRPAAQRGDLVLHIAVQAHARLLQQPCRCRDMTLEQPIECPRAQCPQAQAHHHQQHAARFQHLRQHGALRLVQRGPDQTAAAQAEQRQQQPRRQQRGHPPSVDALQGAAPSICATLAASSLVEKGLVM
jgi:hypothetical protein